jgi:hypothetical protein
MASERGGAEVRRVDGGWVGAEYFNVGAAEVAECDGGGEAGAVEKDVGEPRMLV